MPQADLYFSDDQNCDADVFAEIERLFQDLDGSTAECKARAHPVSAYYRSHMFLRISMLPKAHRDDAYAEELGKRLTAALKPHASAPCEIGVQVRFDLEHYTTDTVS